MFNSTEKLYGFETDEHEFSPFVLQEDAPSFLRESNASQ